MTWREHPCSVLSCRWPRITAAQRSAAYLTRFITNGTGDELKASWDLVAHQLFRKVSHQRSLIDLIGRLDNRVNDGPEIIIGQTDHHAGADAGERVNRRLHLRRIDIDAS